MPEPIPVTEFYIINLKGPLRLRDTSTPEGAMWNSAIEMLKKRLGLRNIYTSTVVEDLKTARIFISRSLFAAVECFY